MVIFCLFFMFCSFCAKKFSLKRQQWCVVIFRIASSKWMLETVAVYALCAHLYDRNWECVYLCEWVCLWCGLDVIRNEYKCAAQDLYLLHFGVLQQILQRRGEIALCEHCALWIDVAGLSSIEGQILESNQFNFDGNMSRTHTPANFSSN